VYTLSALPSFADATRTRLLKTEYIFMPYRPSHAILTAGALSISASTTVTAAAGVDATTAAVHSNATVTGVGNPTVTGPVTSTSASSFSSNNFSSNPGGGVYVKAAQSIPAVSALQFYMRAPTSDPSAIADWYDLCSGGVVRPYGTTGPCTATTTIGTATSSIGIRGWTYTSSSRTWTASKNTLPGTYYAHEANVDTGTGNGTIAKFTVIASAQNPDNCSSKQYGNITWDHYDLTAPAYNNLWMFADTDLVTHSNWKAGSMTVPVVSGMFVAGDQVQLETSSAGAVGSVVAADQCSTASPKGLITTSEVKNPSIYFDPNSDAPFASVITTSLWLDYSGG
uniref:hypothetical protein n=1 Tax=Actinotalea sp. TaxID=1872145 RepID=UPI0035687901